LHAQVIEIEVRDESAARELQFFGSPTIRVNGPDIETGSRQLRETGFACRCYPGGLPSEEMIRAAVREARRQQRMSVQVNAPDSATRPNQHNGARTTFASLAAIGSVLAASSCCLPILPFMMAAGLAGTSTFLSAARPYLLLVAVLFIVYGFYQSWKSEKMPAPAECDHFCPVVDLRNFCGHIHLLSSSDVERSRRATRTVIHEEQVHRRRGFGSHSYRGTVLLLRRQSGSFRTAAARKRHCTKRCGYQDIIQPG